MVRQAKPRFGTSRSSLKKTLKRIGEVQGARRSEDEGAGSGRSL